MIAMMSAIGIVPDKERSGACPAIARPNRLTSFTLWLGRSSVLSPGERGHTSSGTEPIAARPMMSPARDPVISNRGIRQTAQAVAESGMSTLRRPPDLRAREAGTALTAAQASIGNINARNNPWWLRLTNSPTAEPSVDLA